MSDGFIEDVEGRNFTVSWMSRNWDQARDQCEGQPFDHISGDHFRQRGVGTGDNLYSVIVKSGRLHLCACMSVYDVLDSDGAERLLGMTPYEAADHAFAEEATVMRFNRVVPLQVVEQIRFEQKNGLAAPKFKSDGALDPHAFRGVRAITTESAELLEALLEGDEICTFDYSDWEASNEDDDDLDADEEIEDVQPDDEVEEAAVRAASHPETDSKLRALIYAGVTPDDAILVLRRSLSFRGGRFLAVSALERDVLPHLSTPLTAQQADLLVKLAQNAYDEQETVRAIQAL